MFEMSGTTTEEKQYKVPHNILFSNVCLFIF